MTMNPFSLKKSDMLISLALLSPCVLAANNNIDTQPLSFNYSRQDNSADPRLALQSRGCHSKSDPLEIRIKLDNTTLDRDRRLTITIKGAGYLYNYTGLQAIDKDPRMIKVGSTDIKQSFYTPWRVNVTENIKGKYTPWGKLQDTFKKTPAYTFCFTESHKATKHPDQWRNTYGYIPIFEKLPEDGFAYNAIIKAKPDFYYYGDSQFKEACKGKRFLRGPDYYKWSGLFDGKTQDYLQRVDTKFGGAEDAIDILLNSLFYLQESRFNRQIEVGKYYESSRESDLKFDKTNYIVGSGEAKTDGGAEQFTYRIPDDITRPDRNLDIGSVPPSLKIENGVWVLRVNNRNISSISLKIQDRPTFVPKKDNEEDTRAFPEVMNFTWKADPSKDPFNNTLFPVTQDHPGNKDMTFAPSAANANKDWYNDLYQTANFYKDPNNMFRGTLAAGVSLNSTTYDAYMRKYTPLSLPAKIPGAINLVNTDSLEFTIHRPAGTGTTWYVSLTGKPLEFAPLFKHNKIALTAMEVRNACY